MITPFLRAGRAVYYVSFRHPGTGRQINRSLGTSDEHQARQIALDIERICSNPDAWNVTNPVLLNFPDAAVRAFHGCSARVSPETIPLAPVLVNSIALAGELPVSVVMDNPAASDDARTIADLRQQVIDRDIVIAHKDEELQGWRRKYNAHVSIQLGRAVAAWKSSYYDRADDTTEDVFSRVDEFAAFTGPALKLGEVQGSHIDAWLSVYRMPRDSGRKDKEGNVVMLPALEPRSLRRRRGCISIFLNWCVRNYQMNGSPLDHSQPIAGASVEHIVAIRRLDELRTLLKALSLYWRAVAGVGCLAGLRLAEIFWLKKSDIYLSEKYLRVTSRKGGLKLEGTKTRKERNVPIERTTLLPILQEFCASNGAGMWRADQPWAMPSLVETPIWSPRRKTVPGIWCNGNNFRANCEKAIELARAASGAEYQRAEFWTYGPREWRHTAGTAMALSGVSAVAIAKVLGNTPDVCERHYIGVRAEDAGTKWPFEW